MIFHYVAIAILDRAATEETRYRIEVFQLIFHAKNFVFRELRIAFENFLTGFTKFRKVVEKVFRIFLYL